MAAININLSCDLQKPVSVQYLKGNLFSQDNRANKINVAVYNNGIPGSISGDVTADIIRSDGGTVTATGGTISNNVVSITLPAAAYAVTGIVSIAVKVTASNVITTIAAIVANVYQSSTETIIDPGTIIPSVENLISQINAAVASIPADYSSLWASIAPPFDSSESYTKGQLVTYNGHLYRFKQNHTGSWVSSHATQTAVSTELADNKTAVDTQISAINASIGGINADIQGIETALDGLGSKKTVTGTGEIVVQDSTAGNINTLKLTGYSDLYYQCTNAETSSAYRDYGFNICSSPQIRTRNSHSTTISQKTFTGINLMEIDCCSADGTIEASFKDELTIDSRGKVTVIQRNGLITPADIVDAAASAYTNTYSYGASLCTLRITSGSALWNRYQAIAPEAIGVYSRSAIICNIVPPRTNQNSLIGYISVTNSNIIEFKIETSYLPSTVNDDSTFKAWFEANTDIQIFMPLITPETTELSDTVAIKTAQGYTKLTCNRTGTPLSLTYYVDSTQYIENEINRLDGRIDDVEPFYLMKYHVASIISTMCAVGDSLTVGWGINTDPPTDAGISRTNRNISWPIQYGRITGTTVDIIGGSGMTAENFWDNQFVIPGHPNGSFDDVLDVHDPSEVYVIGLGQNFNASTAGSVSDIGQTAAQCNENTFYGAYAKIILTILEKYPKAKVLCLTIPKEGDTAVNTCIRGVCNAVSGALLLDLQANYLDWFTREDIMDQLTTLRNVHYYPIGYSFIAQTMEYAISDYLYTHSSAWHTFGIA